MRRLPILCVLLFVAVYTNAVPYSNEVEDADELSEDIGSPESFENGILDGDVDNHYKRKPSHKHSKEKKKSREHSKEKKSREHSKEKKASKEVNRPTISDDAIFLPHEKFCKYFYVFDGEESRLLSCAKGHRFDAEKLQCLKTKHVNCGKRKKHINSSEEKKVGLNSKCPKWSGLHRHEYYCHLYYSCQNKKGQLFMCPPGMLFDERSNQCAYRGKVDCKKRNDPNANDPNDNDEQPDSEDTTYECEGMKGVVPHPTMCNKYIRCWYGLGDVHVCPKGYLFDADLLSCKSKKSVYCDERIDPSGYDDEEEPILVDDNPDYNCPESKGRFRHGVCAMYYECVMNKPMLYSCPPDKLYDAQKETCRKASEVSCSDDIVNDDDEDFVCPVREGVFKDEADCGSYYKCKNGRVQHHRCPEGELFDTDWKSCYDEDEVTCGDRLHPNDDPEDDDDDNVVDSKPDYKCEKRFGRFTHQEICNYYYQCRDGSPNMRVCRHGRYYDVTTNSCQNQVECGNRRPSNEPRPTIKPEVFKCPSKSGKYPHERDCSAFYKCERRKYKIHYCSKRKLYNEHKKTCEPEHKVTCGSRVHPELDPEEPDDKVIDPNPNFHCDQNFGRYDHDEYCNWYHQCSDGLPSVRECRRGRRYDSYKRKCLEKHEVSCNGKPDNEDEFVTEDPDTEEPETEKPETEEPSSEEPETEEPSSEEPETEEPHTENPETEEPSSEEPDTEEPETEKPETEEPSSEEPETEEPSSEKPETEEPHTENPETEEPSSEETDTEEPETEEPSSEENETEEPDTEEPDSEKPEDKIIDPKPNFVCQKDQGRYIHKEYCNWYYQCNKGKPSLLRCGKGMRYDSHKRKCRDKDVVKCNKRKDNDGSEEDEEPTVVDPSPNYECSELEGIFRHDVCSMFYQCNEGQATLYACPPGKLYDAHVYSCRKAEEVSCDDIDREEKTTTSEEPTTLNPVTEEDPTTTSTEDPTTTSTEDPTTTSTEKPTTTTTEEPTTTQEPLTTPEVDEYNQDKIVDYHPNYNCGGDDGDFAHEEACHFYYSCYKNKPVIRQCPDGMFFDIERGHCNDWYLVTCGDRLGPDEINPTFKDHRSTPYGGKTTKSRVPITTEVPPTTKPFVCPSSEGFFPHERNCGKYYLCINNNPEVRTCPEGQLYDIDKKGCNDEEDTNCGKRIHPNDDPDNPDKIPDKVIDPDPDFNCEKRHGCFSHEVFCKWYYYCHDKRPEVRECSGDQYFDSVRNKCLEWWMVFCDKRSTPDDGLTKSTPGSSKETDDDSRRGTGTGEDATRTTPGDGRGTDDDSRRGTGTGGEDRRTTSGDGRGTDEDSRRGTGTGVDDTRTTAGDGRGTDDDSRRGTGTGRDATRTTSGDGRGTGTGGDDRRTTPGDGRGTGDDSREGTGTGGDATRTTSGDGRGTDDDSRRTGTDGDDRRTTPGDGRGTDDDSRRGTGTGGDDRRTTPGDGRGTDDDSRRGTGTGGDDRRTTPGDGRGTDEDSRRGTGTGRDATRTTSGDGRGTDDDSKRGTGTGGDDRRTTPGDGRGTDDDSRRGTGTAEDLSKDETTGVTTPTSETERPIKDKCKEEDGDFHHPKDCKKYYTCKDGEFETNECPDSMLFDRNLRFCQDDNKVDCGNREKPQTTLEILDDCDEWLRTRTTPGEENTSTPLGKGTTGPSEGTGGTDPTETSTKSEKNESTVDENSTRSSTGPDSKISSTDQDGDSGKTYPSSSTDEDENGGNSRPSSSTDKDGNGDNTRLTSSTDKDGGNTQPTTNTYKDGDDRNTQTTSSTDKDNENTQSTSNVNKDIDDGSTKPTSITDTDGESGKTQPSSSTDKDGGNTQSTSNTDNDEESGKTQPSSSTDKDEDGGNTQSTSNTDNDEESGKTQPSSSTDKDGGNTQSTSNPDKDENGGKTKSTSTTDNEGGNTRSTSNTDKDDGITQSTSSINDRDGGNTQPTSNTDKDGDDGNTGSTNTTDRNIVNTGSTSSTDKDGDNTPSTSTGGDDNQSSNNPNTDNPHTVNDVTDENGNLVTSSDELKRSTLNDIEITNNDVLSTKNEKSTNQPDNTPSDGLSTGEGENPSDSTTDNTDNDQNTNPTGSSTKNGENTTPSGNKETDDEKTNTEEDPNNKTTSVSTKSTESNKTPTESDQTSENTATNQDNTRNPDTDDNKTTGTSSTGGDGNTQSETTATPKSPQTDDGNETDGNTDSENDPTKSTSDSDNGSTGETKEGIKTNPQTDSTKGDGTDENKTGDDLTKISTTDGRGTDANTKEGREASTASTDEFEITHEYTTQHPCLTHTHSTHSTVAPTDPPPLGCRRDDIDCVMKKIRDIRWYKCASRHGSYPHPQSDLVFIQCRNWRPQLKKCGKNMKFSKEYMRCVNRR